MHIPPLRSTLGLFAFLCALITNAQGTAPPWCISSGASPSIIRQAQERGDPRGAIRYVKVKAIIGSLPGPGGDACAPSAVQRDIDEVNTMYANSDAGIQFLLCGPIQVVDDAAIATPMVIEPAVLNPYFEPGTLLLVYSSELPMGLGGFTLGDIVWVRGHGGASLTAHELGHALGLLHTHDFLHEPELADGSNCSTGGDMICDTPADPNLFAPGMVNSHLCVYTGTAVDANGQPYDPMVNNIMSYSPCHLDTLTPGQCTLMRYVLDHVKVHLQVTLSPVLIAPFDTRQCHNSGPLELSATPGPGSFDGPLVSGQTIQNAPNAPGSYHVTYTPNTPPEDSTVLVDQSATLLDQYNNYQYGHLVLDSMVQTIRAGMDGRLTTVEFLLHSAQANEFRLRVYQGTGGSAVLMGTRSIAVPAMVDTAWVSMPAADGIQMTADETYTLELKAARPFVLTTTPGYGWAGLDYMRGTSSFGDAWSDAAFRTHLYTVPPCQTAIRYYEVYQPPAYALLNLANAYCPDSEEAVHLMGPNDASPAADIWVAGQHTSSFVPATLGQGTHPGWYINTTYACTDTTAFTVLVERPKANINNLPEVLCMDQPPFPLEADPPGGTFTINGNSMDTVDPASLGQGMHTVAYTFTGVLDTVDFREQWCCGYPATAYARQTPIGVADAFQQSFTPAFTGRLERFRAALSATGGGHAFAVAIHKGEGINGELLGTDVVVIPPFNNMPVLNGNMHPTLHRDSLYTFHAVRLPGAPEMITSLYTFVGDWHPGGTGAVNGAGGIDIGFELHLSHTYGCAGSEAAELTVEVCTGLSEVDQEKPQASPNPFREDFVLHTPHPAQWMLYDALGSQVASGQTGQAGSTTIATQDAAPGLYLLHVFPTVGQAPTIIRLAKTSAQFPRH